MEDDSYQKELFEFEKPKRAFPRLSGMLPKSDFEGKVLVSLTLEKLIFIAIGIIMTMVLVFAIGVEKGKSVAEPLSRISRQPQELPQSSARNVTTQAPGKGMTRSSGIPAVNELKPLSVKKNVTAKTADIKQAPQKKAQSVPVSGVNAGTALYQGRPYTIVINSYKQKEYALQEMYRLRKEGYDATIVQDKPYLLVCVGAYTSKESASKALARVRLKFQSAYLKLR